METKRQPLERLGIVVFAVLIGGAADSSQGGPVTMVGQDVPAARRIPVAQIDHTAWDRLLQKYVDAAGMVNYAAWKASAADVKALEAYLDHLSAADLPALGSRAAQMAFWINAYNALTIHGILREYPTTSIRNHTARLFGYNIWKDLRLQVGGHAYSLDAIEHEVLRKMGDPRIHFAIVCASIGCPPLLNRAYTAARLEEQLTANAKTFFADPGKFQYDESGGIVALSPIIQWFAEDFGATQTERVAWIAPYLPDPAVVPAVRSGSVRVRYLGYDWGLNDQAGVQRPSRR